MPSLIDLLHSKIELFRLEQRYTRRRNRRSTFHSEATYVDGEYIYSNPNSSSSHNSSNASSPSSKTSYTGKWVSGNGSERSGSDSDDVASSPVQRHAETEEKEKKGSKRMSRLGLERMDWRKGKHVEGPVGGGRVSVREVRWER